MRKVFPNWPGRIKIISDPHFNDGDIWRSERSHFASQEDHDNAIKKLIKQGVSGGNTLLLLGDLGEDWQDFIKHLKCYKVLVMGNHDERSPDYYREFFDEVYPTGIPLTDRVYASHQPMMLDTRYFINVHGHLHNSRLKDPHYINANVHETKYKLLDLEDIDRYARSFEYNDKETGPKAQFLREWYADKYDITDLIVTAKGGVAYYHSYLSYPEKELIPVLRNGKEQEKIFELANIFNPIFKSLDIDYRVNTHLTDYQDIFDKYPIYDSVEKSQECAIRDIELRIRDNIMEEMTKWQTQIKN